jgi:two-component system, cell cycle sensor histidine kinase and response regulator CckA
MNSLISECEALRLAALYRYQILDTDAEPAFDDLTRLAAQICQTPIALISLVDEQRLWFKSKIGLTVSETSRDNTLCAYAIQRDGTLIVENALVDRRFSKAALVTGEPYVRFYAGVPLITPQGYRIGTLCVIDRIQRQLSAEQVEALKALSRQVISQLELRQNLQILQERENRLQAIINAEPECIKIVDRNGKLLEMNPAGLAMIEANDSNPVLGKSVYSLIAPEYRSTYQTFNEQVCQGKGGIFDFELIGCQGTRKHVESHAVPLKIEPDGSLVQLAITRDITARRQAEEALHQQIERERLQVAIAQRIRQSLDLSEILNTTVAEVRQFLQTDRVLIYRFHPDWSGRITVESVDPAWVSVINVQVQDCCFQEPSRRAIYEQGQIQAVDDIYNAGLTPCHIEMLAQFQVRANLVVPILQGAQLWGLLVAHHCSAPRQWQPAETDLLKQLATQVEIAIHQAELYEQVQTELNDRIQAEKTIREQAALLDVATDAILVRDLNHQITYWNKGAERLYGWSTAEACGKSAIHLLYPAFSTHSTGAYEAVLREGRWQGELQQRTKDGKAIIVESRWTLVNHRDGEPKAILMVNTDITQKKQLEQQFLRAQRMESIGTLAGGIAHDLNNVLAPILMSVPLLECHITNPDDPKSRQWLDIIETSARRGANLVKQVLSFARGMEGERSLLEIKHLIWEIQQIAEETFPKLITFSTNLSRGLWTVCGDATQLHQILMNLCLNARDAMPNGGMLRVTAQNLMLTESMAQLHLDAQAGAYIVITVSDTGTGITADILDRIFDPFFTTKDIGKGTGLGLSTVLSIIKGHGGFVTVASQVGQGTEFKVYLPAIPDGETEQTTDLAIPDGAGTWVLIAEDEVAIRETVRTTLEIHGYQVITACNGMEAIALYAQHQTDIQLALINLMMPSIDGAVVIRTLQTINPQLKIIATSGLISNEQITAIEIKPKYFLPKPFTSQELLSTLHQVLNTQ